MSMIEQLKSNPFTLSLSAGYFGFFAHLGLLKVLEEENLRPQRIAGASAGAIAGGLWAAGAKSEDIKNILIGIKKKDFWDPGFGLGINKGYKFEKILQNYLPKKFSDTKIPFSVTAVEVPRFKTHVIDKGLLAPAIRASAALPGLFQPVKRNAKYFIDGGVFDKTGLVRRDEHEVALCHYLLSAGFWGRLEKYRDRNIFQPQDILIFAESVVRLGPSRLHLGEDAFQESYQRVRAELYKN
jgi:NTE family protein